MTFRFHLLGFPHTATNREYTACAYTQKLVKFISMMAPRGHTIFDYSNVGFESSLRSQVEEHVDILSEAERASFFGAHDRNKLYDLKWEGSQPYWKLFNDRAIEALKPRVKKGDFILTLAGADCHQAIGDAFPGAYSGTPTSAMMVEFGIGYYGTFSRYRVFESHGHREFVYGMAHYKGEDNDSVVIPNYFDVNDFVVKPEVESRLSELISKPYYLFIGRLIEDKGLHIVNDIMQSLWNRGSQARLILAGQGKITLENLNNDDDIVHFGCATIEERAVLMSHAIATLAPTRYREPFGGVAVESQLCGTPAITTEHGAFLETVCPEFRCASHREFVDAAKRAARFRQNERDTLQVKTEVRYSLQAIAPQYERYFQRLFDRWGAGWYQEEPLTSV